MKRALATCLTATLLLASGCSKDYEVRLNRTLDRMRYMQRLDQNLNPAPTEKFQDLNIYVRPPLPLTPAQQPGLNAPEGQFDLVASFLDVSGGGEAAKEEATPAPPVRLHVLARLNRKKTPTKKGAPTPPAPENRGEFVADVRQLLASDLGSDEALSNTLQNEKKGLNDYKRLIFKASNGDTIRAYFLKKGEHDVALVWDIPPGKEKAREGGSAADLTMESMFVGPLAASAFQGVDVGDLAEGGAPAAAGAGGPAAAGPAF